MDEYTKVLTSLGKKLGTEEKKDGYVSFQIPDEKMDEYREEKAKLDATECELASANVLPVSSYEKVPLTPIELGVLVDSKFVVAPPEI